MAGSFEEDTGRPHPPALVAAVHKARSTDPAGAAEQAAGGDYSWRRTPSCSRIGPSFLITVSVGMDPWQ